jgi:hypothetical protein
MRFTVKIMRKSDGVAEASMLGVNCGANAVDINLGHNEQPLNVAEC